MENISTIVLALTLKHRMDKFNIEPQPSFETFLDTIRLTDPELYVTLFSSLEKALRIYLDSLEDDDE